jgi:hypothetical protein
VIFKVAWLIKIKNAWLPSSRLGEKKKIKIINNKQATRWRVERLCLFVLEDVEVDADDGVVGVEVTAMMGSEYHT